MAVYKRVLLKLSGEALKTGSDLFDFDQVHRAAAVIRKMADMGTQIGIVIGAGNIWRGRQGPAANMDAVTADQMGMLGTVINCLCMADALRQAGVDAVVMSAVDMNRFCEPFNAMTARRYLSEGRVVLFAAGSGNPFFSTDTAVALRAIEMQVDAILMAKNIDGVYTADPHKDPNATLWNRLRSSRRTPSSPRTSSARQRTMPRRLPTRQSRTLTASARRRKRKSWRSNPSMVNMPNVLGMRLEDALAECRAQGVEPEIVMTLPPKGREQGTIRVIRAKEGVLTVSRFEDELSPVVQ